MLTSVRLWLFVSLSAVACLGATFDVATFTPPSGWQAQTSPTYVSYSHIDQAAKNFCMIAVYNSRVSSGDPAREFATEWKEIVQAGFTAGPAPRASAGEMPSRLRFVEGAAMARSGANPVLVELITFGAAGNRVASVLIVATDRKAFDARGPAIRDFLESLRFAGEGPVSGSAPVPPASGAAPKASGNGVVGVWMGFRPTMPGSYELQPRWYTIFEDGQVFEDLPRNGLLGFDRNSSRANPNERPYWGTWQFQGGSGQIAKPGVRFTERLTLESQNLLVIDSDRFSRCASVDGLRLAGSWTSYSDPNDPYLAQRPVGERPVFTFTRDGRFVDEGAFAGFLKSFGTDGTSLAAGSGTYEIRDFTLVLRYTDGRVLRAAFSGMASGDPAVKNDIVFIGRARFNKRR